MSITEFPSENPFFQACHPESELILQATARMLKHSHEKIFVKDKNLIYRAASQKFVNMAGWENVSDIIGKTDFDIFEDKELAASYRADDELLIERQTDLVDLIEPLTEKDGKPRYASTSKFILRDSNGDFFGLVGVSRDVTMEYYLQRNQIRELEYLFALPPDIYVAFYMDIDAWRIVSEHHHVVKGIDFSFLSTIDAFIDNCRSRVIDQSNPVYEFLSHFTQKKLTELYQGGTNTVVFEYQRRMLSDDIRWVRTEVSFLHDSVTGNLSVMLTIRDIQQRKSDEEERVRLADRDELTGLLNRKATMQLIRDRLAQSTPNEKHALFMIDADYFKDVNNTYGHQAGDQALADFARTIGNTFRSTDLIGRIGGDEFFVLMTSIPDRDAVERKAQNLLEALRTVHYEQVYMSASIGISIYPNDSMTLEDMYALSDKAMYAVKDRGRNGICFISDILSART